MANMLCIIKNYADSFYYCNQGKKNVSAYLHYVFVLEIYLGVPKK